MSTSTSTQAAIVKWLAGVAATLITSLSVWMITRTDAPLTDRKLDRPPPIAVAKKKPVITIMSFNGYQQVVGANPRITIELNNDGDAAAGSCRMWWNPTNPTVNSAGWVYSFEFGLIAGEHKKLGMEFPGRVWTQRGDFHGVAQVLCEHARSPAKMTFVSVTPRVATSGTRPTALRPRGSVASNG